MARSGSFNTTAYDSRCIQFSWEIVNQNIATNQTRIKWNIKAVGSGTYSQYYAGNFKVLINGTQVYFSSTRINTTNGLLIKSDELTLIHNADGTRSFTAYVEAGIYTYAVNCTGSATFTLDAIPRAASLTETQDFNDEQNPTIKYTNPAGSAVTALDACISFDGTVDHIKYRAVSKTGTSYTFTLTDAERAVLRDRTANAQYANVKFILRTNIGGALYYSVWTRKMSIVNAAPTLNPVIRDTDADLIITGGEALVRYISNAYVETGAAAKKGATIKSQSITCGGVTVEGASGTFESVTSGDFVFTVTDSRGYTTTKPVSFPFVEYVKLTCSIGNSKPDTDGRFTLTASGVCYNGDMASAGSNDLYVLYRYKASGGTYSDWGEMSITRTGNSYTAAVNFTGLDYRTTYIFQCRAGDLVMTVDTDEVAIKALPVFDWSGEDFNFNVPVRAPGMTLGDVQLDYILEQGTINGWTYRKWAGGVLECWKSLVYKTAINNQWGNLYISPTGTERQSYPYPFISKPVEIVTVQGNHPAWVISASGGEGVNGTYASGRYHLCSPGTYTSVEHYMSYYVKGKWK